MRANTALVWLGALSAWAASGCGRSEALELPSLVCPGAAGAAATGGFGGSTTAQGGSIVTGGSGGSVTAEGGSVVAGGSGGATVAQGGSAVTGGSGGATIVQGGSAVTGGSAGSAGAAGGVLVVGDAGAPAAAGHGGAAGASAVPTGGAAGAVSADTEFEERARALVAQMTLEEKVSQLGNSAPAIPRLGIISYGWWNEALHGVAWSGVATVFPQAISFARTFDPELIHEVATAISTEARIMNNTSSKRLTYWSPTVNLARDPRWGRNEESYGEDPLLAARIATAFVRGMQGDDPRYLKTVSTPKHFVANNEEARRHTGSSEVDERNLRDFYMPAFRAAVEDGGAFSVMCAYNAVNGVPACANSWLLGTVLRQQWGFGGYVVSDCGAVEDIVSGHLYTETAIEASAAALGAGTDLNCGVRFQTDLVEAVTTGVVTEERIDEALVRLFFVRFKLGEFDPPEQVPYRSIPEAEFDGPEHRALAERTARASMVLLKNEGLLPLSATALESIAVIGPNAHRIVFGGYSGAASEPVTPLAGLQARLVGTTATVRYAQGTGVLAAVSETAIEEAAAVAAESEVAVVVLGSDQTLSSEGLDRSNIDLPAVQQQLLEAVVTANPNTVLVLVAGMPFAIPWAAENVPAILDAGYAGQAAGTAIAGALFGDFSPAGRLPQTYYLSTDDLLPFDDYDLTHGRTYMFFEGPVLYPFGHGLGYSDFTYSNLEVTPATLAEQDVFTVSFDLGNSGAMVADEVAQVYVHDVEAKVSVPVRKLVGFARLELVPGEVQRVTIDVKRSDLGFFDVDTDAFVVEPGDFEVFVGASSADTRLQGLLTVE